MSKRTIEIDGEQILYPTSFSWKYQDLQTEESGRSNLTGKMIMELVRKGVRSFTMQWQLVGEDVASVISKKIKKNKYINVKFPDTYEGTDIVLEFYSGDISSNSVSFTNGKIYYSLSIDLVQV